MDHREAFDDRLRKAGAFVSLQAKDVLAIIDHIGEVTAAEMTGKSRKHRIVVWRHALCYIVLPRRHCTQDAIGHVIGGRDHATVIHGHRSFDNRLSTRDPECERVIRSILSVLEYLAEIKGEARELQPLRPLQSLLTQIGSSAIAVRDGTPFGSPTQSRLTGRAQTPATA